MQVSRRLVLRPSLLRKMWPRSRPGVRLPVLQGRGAAFLRTQAYAESLGGVGEGAGARRCSAAAGQGAGRGAGRGGGQRGGARGGGEGGAAGAVGEASRRSARALRRDGVGEAASRDEGSVPGNGETAVPPKMVRAGRGAVASPPVQSRPRRPWSSRSTRRPRLSPGWALDSLKKPLRRAAYVSPYPTPPSAAATTPAAERLWLSVE